MEPKDSNKNRTEIMTLCYSRNFWKQFIYLSRYGDRAPFDSISFEQSKTIIIFIVTIIIVYCHFECFFQIIRSVTRVSRFS